jgi:hypothetical protein
MREGASDGRADALGARSLLVPGLRVHVGGTLVRRAAEHKTGLTQ